LGVRCTESGAPVRALVEAHKVAEIKLDLTVGLQNNQVLRGCKPVDRVEHVLLLEPSGNGCSSGVGTAIHKYRQCVGR